MNHRIDAAVAAEIGRLRALGCTYSHIARETGVGVQTAKRYSEGAYRRDLPTLRAHPHPEIPPRPLYDPRRDGAAEQSLTAQICGDPQPGRRQLVAGHVTRYWVGRTGAF